MAETPDWMTAERVDRDLGILQRFVTDVAASRRSPSLAKACTETIAGGNAHDIVSLSGLVRTACAAWAQDDWNKEKAAEASRANVGMHSEKPEAAPTTSRGCLVSMQGITGEQIDQIFERLTGRKPTPEASEEARRVAELFRAKPSDEISPPAPTD